jgi:hypothetical protein
VTAPSRNGSTNIAALLLVVFPGVSAVSVGPSVFVVPDAVSPPPVFSPSSPPAPPSPPTPLPTPPTPPPPPGLLHLRPPHCPVQEAPPARACTLRQMSGTGGGTSVRGRARTQRRGPAIIQHTADRALVSAHTVVNTTCMRYALKAGRLKSILECTYLNTLVHWYTGTLVQLHNISCASNIQYTTHHSSRLAAPALLSPAAVPLRPG